MPAPVFSVEQSTSGALASLRLIADVVEAMVFVLPTSGSTMEQVALHCTSP